MALQEGDIIRVVASLVFPDDVIMQNVFHLVLTTIVGDGDEDTVSEDLADYVERVYSEMDSEISEDISSSDVKLYVYDDIDDDFDQIGTEVWALPTLAGTDFIPHGVACVINLFTTDPDVQGRKFFGGWKDARVVDGAWVGVSTTAQLLIGADIVASFNGGPSANVYTPGVWSPTRTNFYAFNGVFVLNTTPGYQRRRKPGVGI